MAQTAHTPGPWKYEPTSGEICYADGDVEPLIATVELDGTSGAQGRADGALISAAPDLLVAARWMQEFIEAVNENRVTQDQRDLYSSMMATATAAIAKATTPA